MMGHSAAELMVSSPRWKTGFFYDCCTKKPLGYDVIKVPLSACPHWSAEQIEDKRRKLTPGAFAMDCLAEFHQGENRVFPDEDIFRAVDESLPLFSPGCTFVNPYPDRSYSFGFDISKIGCDKWSLMIGDFASNHLTIRAYHNWMGTKHSTSGYNATYTDDPNEIQRTVVEYAKTFRPHRVYCDGTSNEYYCHELLNKCLLPVEQINWSAKEKIIEHARTCFSAGRISIPNDPDLINELLSYSYDIEAMKDGESRILYIGGGDDDEVSALAMALTIIHADPEFSFNDRIIAGRSTRHDDLRGCKRQVPKRVVSLAASKRSLVRT